MILLRFLLCGIAAAALALPAQAQPHVIEKTTDEIDTAVILYGRACRGASDQEWVIVCTAAVTQARKELEAKKTKPPEEKKQ